MAGGTFTISRFLFPQTSLEQAGSRGTTEGLWRGYSSTCPKGAICWAPVAVTQADGGSSVLSLLCAKDQTNETVSTNQIFSKFSGRLWRGFLGMFFPLLFPPVLQLSPGTQAWPKLMKLRLWCLIEKNSLWDKAIRGGFLRIQREATLQGANHCRGQGLGPQY